MRKSERIVLSVFGILIVMLGVMAMSVAVWENEKNFNLQEAETTAQQTTIEETTHEAPTEETTTETTTARETTTEAETHKSQKVSLGVFELTAYCACAKCCGKTNGITASGTKAKQGRTIAADTSLPFGTKVSINGHEYVVEDRGGSITSRRIDIFFNSHQEALNFGRQRATVYVINES